MLKSGGQIRGSPRGSTRERSPSSDVFSWSFYTWARIKLHLEAQNTWFSDFLKGHPSPISVKTPSRAHTHREKDQEKTSEDRAEAASGAEAAGRTAY